MGNTHTGRQGWRVYTSAGTYVATGYADAYTAEELLAAWQPLYPASELRLEPLTLERDNRW